MSFQDHSDLYLSKPIEKLYTYGNINFEHKEEKPVHPP